MMGMWGSRCRVRIVIPAVIVETALTEFYRILLDGVTIVITHLSIEILEDDDIMRAAQQRDDAVRLLASEKVNCVIAAGAPITRRLGPKSDIEFIQRAEKDVGIPVTTSQAAALDAFKALGGGRVAVASPYHVDQDEETRAFLESNDVEVALSTVCERMSSTSTRYRCPQHISTPRQRSFVIPRPRPSMCPALSSPYR